MRIAILLILTMIFPRLKAQDDGVKVGSMLPVFELMNQDGELESPTKLVGKHFIIVYFYPKDDTPGCTKEACSFRDNDERIKNLNGVVFGISSDSVEDHKAFSKKYNLNFSLLADVDGSARKAFNVPSNLMGLIPGRVTYIFNLEGVCVHVFDSQTNPNKHIEESLRIIESL